jgi:hypothetical protein
MIFLGPDGAVAVKFGFPSATSIMAKVEHTQIVKSYSRHCHGSIAAGFAPARNRR